MRPADVTRERAVLLAVIGLHQATWFGLGNRSRLPRDLPVSLNFYAVRLERLLEDLAADFHSAKYKET